MSPKISPLQAYYIKLGSGGEWEADSLKQRILRFGYREAPHKACLEGDWNAVRQIYLEIRDNEGAATRDANQIRVFYEAGEDILWITFSGGFLWWCFAVPGVEEHPDGDGRIRRTADGWHNTDVNGRSLTIDRLSGNLLKVQAFRGTICEVGAFDYLVRRLNGELLPEVQEAKEAEEALVEAIVPMMRLLTWQDFELLVDLIFANSGWRRVGVVGKTQKTVDLELVLPTTGERAFVQVKSSASNAEMQDYRQRNLRSEAYDRMFFVWHSGDLEAVQDDDVTLIGPQRLARMVLDAGLVSWLREKVS